MTGRGFTDSPVREAEEPRSPDRRRPVPLGPRWRLLAGGTAVVLAGTTVIVVITTRDPAPTAATTALPTAPVVRTDLVDRQRIDGTLGYAGSYVVVGHGGTLTWLPAAGAVIRRGQAAYRADGRPVPLLYGAAPLWRTLAPGVRGSDVKILQRNLAALGHDVGADGRFGASTAAAVRRWQRRLGVPRTGSVRAGDVVVQPGAVRITTVVAAPGTRAQGIVLRAGGTRRLVTVNLPVDRQRLAVRNARVSVELPGGRSTTGRVTDIGAVASAPQAGAQPTPAATAPPGQAVQNAAIEVGVTLDHPGVAGRLDRAPVTVGFTSETHRGVLAVPVTALVAVRPQSYAVRVVRTAATPLTVPVRLGLFTDGQVEVSGPGLAAGLRVEVPRP